MTKAVRRVLPALLALAAVGCGGAGASTPSSGEVEEMRTAAVRLVLADVNATGLPRAYDRKVLRRRMRQYVASGWLDRRLELKASSMSGGRDYYQPWADAITVGRWEEERLTGRTAVVVFLAYETVFPGNHPYDLPIRRFTVRMVREEGRWRLASYDKDWLTGAGPMGTSGKLTIRSLDERIVFRNPRPRTWRWRGPRIPGSA